MTDTKTTLIWHLKDEVSGPARGIGGALGGLVNPATLAIGAVAGVGAALIGAAQAAAVEEVNIKKLDAALVASIPGWDGNTEAIEATITARENLAFSDDELRGSMALLVTATNDVEEATHLQAIAMDLARLKGVDLETATIAVAKASEGSTRELKALGLTVDDTATAQENLATIAAAAAGQSEAYAETTSAKWEILQNKFGNVVEEVGAKLLPVLTTLLEFAIDKLIPAIEDVVEVIGPVLKEAFRIVGEYISWWIDNIIKPAIEIIEQIIEDVSNFIDSVAEAIDFVAEILPGEVGASKGPQARATGGPVVAGGIYTVGEQGPETLLMGSRSGTIIPGGASTGIPVEIPIIIDGREVARVVDEHLYFDLRRAAPQLGRA